MLLGSFVRSIGSGIIWVFSTHLLLQMAPDEVRGRVFASDFMFFYLGAALDTSLTISSLIWTLAAISVVPTVLWTVWIMIRKEGDCLSVVSKPGKLEPGSPNSVGQNEEFAHFASDTARRWSYCKRLKL